MFAVTSSVSEKILEVQLLEVGNLWYKSFSTNSIFSIFSTYLDLYSIYTYIYIIALCVAVYYIHQLFCVPINRIRLLGDLGYIPFGYTGGISPTILDFRTVFAMSFIENFPFVIYPKSPKSRILFIGTQNN
jgi:hypothetical protein